MKGAYFVRGVKSSVRAHIVTRSVVQSGGLKNGSSHGIVTRPGAMLETTLEQVMLFKSPIGMLDQGHQDAS